MFSAESISVQKFFDKLIVFVLLMHCRHAVFLNICITIFRHMIGARALIVLHDSRFQNNDSQNVIEILEVDLNQHFFLIYLAPNFTLTLQDFINHINLEVQTIGFGSNWMGENLHLDITFIGRISNHISSIYRINTRPRVGHNLLNYTKL